MLTLPQELKRARLFYLIEQMIVLLNISLSKVSNNVFLFYYILYREHVQSEFSEDQILGELIINVVFSPVMSPIIYLHLYLISI